MGLTYRAFQTYEIDAPRLSTANAYRPLPRKHVAVAPVEPKPTAPTLNMADTIIQRAKLIADEHLGGFTKDVAAALIRHKPRAGTQDAAIRACVFGRLNADYMYRNSEIADAFNMNIQTVQLITRRWKEANRIDTRVLAEAIKRRDAQ